jgi:hypothetical protein
VQVEQWVYVPREIRCLEHTFPMSSFELGSISGHRTTNLVGRLCIFLRYRRPECNLLYDARTNMDNAEGAGGGRSTKTMLVTKQDPLQQQAAQALRRVIKFSFQEAHDNQTNAPSLPHSLLHSSGLNPPPKFPTTSSSGAPRPVFCS